MAVFRERGRDPLRSGPEIGLEKQQDLRIRSEYLQRVNLLLLHLLIDRLSSPPLLPSSCSYSSQEQQLQTIVNIIYFLF